MPDGIIGVVAVNMEEINGTLGKIIQGIIEKAFHQA